MDICIDTQILVLADDTSSSYHAFLQECAAHEGFRLAVDPHIQQEYNKQMTWDRIGQHWLRQLASADRIAKTDRGNLKKPVKVKLLDKFHFSPDDLKFVRVAIATDSKRLTSEDDDYSKAVKALLLSEEGLRVECCADTRAFIGANQPTQALSNSECKE